MHAINQLGLLSSCHLFLVLFFLHNAKIYSAWLILCQFIFISYLLLFSTQGIDRIVFRELLHSTFDIVTEEILMERIFCAWDKAHEGLPLRLEGWLIGLSIFLRGTPTEKIQFCFRVYDINSDGFITRDEMFTLLKNCLIKQPQDEDPDEGVRDLVEIILRKFDIDKDGKVSIDCFIVDNKN